MARQEHWLPSLMLVLIFTTISTIGAIAGEQGALLLDPERGKNLATRLCVNCHVVSEESAGPVPDGVPSFNAIANKPGQTADHIRQTLVQPHPPMPNAHLTRQEIDDIIAYLDKLRAQDAGAPLLEYKSEPELPTYPEPS